MARIDVLMLRPTVTGEPGPDLMLRLGSGGNTRRTFRQHDGTWTPWAIFISGVQTWDVRWRS